MHSVLCVSCPRYIQQTLKPLRYGIGHFISFLELFEFCLTQCSRAWKMLLPDQRGSAFIISLRLGIFKRTPKCKFNINTYFL